MKINKLFFGLLAVAGLLFTACHENDDDDYKWATVSGEQVFFDFSLPSRVDLDKDANSFTIPLKRLNTSSAITVPLTATLTPTPVEEGQTPTIPEVTFPTSATFNAGQAETTITINYDPATFKYDDYVSVDLAVDNAQATNYGKNIYKFGLGIPSPLELLGTGVFAENYWFGLEAEVEIYQNTENRNEFRIKDPFGALADQGLDGNQSEWLVFRILKPGDVLGNLTITMNDLVYFDVINTGDFQKTYGADAYMYHPVDMASKYTEEGMSHSRVLAYQDNGLPGQVQLDPAYLLPDGRGWNGWGDDGQVIITFPDYVPLDMAAEAHYEGIFTNVEEQVFAVANLKLGKDATDVRAVVVPLDADADAVADAIASGDLEATEVTTGRIEVPVGEDMTGKLQIVIVMLYEGKVMNIVTVPFEYYGGGKNPWQSLGMGLYTDDFILPLFGGQPVTYEVEVQENTETPGLYRMVKPYVTLPGVTENDLVDPSQPFNIEIDATDPDGVILNEQPIGLDFGYGPMYICSYGAYMLSEYDFATLKQYGFFGALRNGTILLPTFRRLNEDNTPKLDEDGNEMLYQGLVFDDDGGYYACPNGAFKLVLPEAVTQEAKAKAKKMAKANQFALRLAASGKKFDSQKARCEMNRRLPVKKIVNK